MMICSITACAKTEKQKEQTKQGTTAVEAVKSTSAVKTSTEKKQQKKEKSKKEGQENSKKATATKKKTTKSAANSVDEKQKNKSQATTKKAEQEKESTTAKQAATESAKEPEEKYFEITISCRTVLNHKDKLQSNYQIPSEGKIYSGKMKIQDGETAMTALRRTGVETDTSKGYVQGIDGLYEFDCGRNSGWMYKVNGTFPNVGAPKYTVEAGDHIQWLYTCQKGDI